MPVHIIFLIDFGGHDYKRQKKMEYSVSIIELWISEHIPKIVFPFFMYRQIWITYIQIDFISDWSRFSTIRSNIYDFEILKYLRI